MSGPAADTALLEVPGRPDRVRAAAAQLEEISAGLLRLAALVRGLAAADWHGVAAAAFRQLVSLDAEPLGRAGAVLAQAAEHLQAHATVLGRAQDDAREAVLLDRRAAWLTELWRVTTAAPTSGTSFGAPAGAGLGAGPGADPGEPVRERSRRLLVEARRRVAVNGAQAATALRSAARLAPDEPGRAGRALGRLWAQSRELSVGSVESSLELLALAARFSTGRAVADPAGYLQDVGAGAGGAVQGVQHPLALGRAVLDLDTVEESPARWVGHALPSAALGVATAGGSVATRSSSLTVQALSRAPGSRATALRAAVVERSAYGRSGLRARDLRSVAGPPSRLGTVVAVPREAAAVGSAMARDARWAERHLTPRVEEAFVRSGGARVGGDHAVKQVPSLRRKLADDLDRLADVPSPTTAAARQVDDTVRYTVVHTDDRYVSGALRTVEELRGQGFELARAKCTWGGSRYQGLNLVWHDPRTGRLFEVQVHSPGSWDATVRTHEAYELYRDRAVDPATKHRLERYIAGQYTAVPRPAGIETLVGELRAAGLDTAPHASPPLLVGPDLARLLRRVGAAPLTPTGGAPPSTSG